MLLVEVALQEIHYIRSQYIYEIIILLLTFPLSYIYLSFNDIDRDKISLINNRETEGNVPSVIVPND